MTELIEAVGSVTKKDGEWYAKIIAADVRGSSAYYPGTVLKEYAHKFVKGTQMFKNHLSMDEQWSRPEGDVNALIGALKETATFEANGPEGPGLYAPLKIFEDQKAWLKERKDHVGLSIRANGIVREDEDGVPVVESITDVQSVDVVTKAGAGGKFVSLAESARPDVLTEASPVEEPSHEKETEMEFPKELAEALDTQAKDVKALTEAVSTLIASLAPKEEQKLEESEVNPLDVAAALVESGLPKASQERVVSAVKGGAVLAEAVKAEQDYVKGIVEAAKPAPKKDDEGNFEANLEESNKSEDFKLGSIFG